MRNAELDLTAFEEKISLHRYLKETLDFPFYYGANLDALNDELTSTTEPLHIVVKYPAAPKGEMLHYLAKVLCVFRDAAQQNYNLKVEFVEIPESVN